MLTRTQYIEKVIPIALKAVKNSSVFPQTIIAQSIIESQKEINGKYYPGETLLSKKYNNYFGIKAGVNWKGESVNLKTREQTSNGADYYIKDNFRVYNNIQESFNDFVHFLNTNSRYKKAIKATNYNDQIKEIAKAGYATDNNYYNIVSNVANSVNETILKSIEYLKKNKNNFLYGAGILFTAFLLKKIFK